MNKILKNGFIILLSLMMFIICGCSNNSGYVINDYSYSKESPELLYFSSSDSDFNFFLNDYLKRHSGWINEDGVDQKVNSVTAGVNTHEFFWQEWTSLSYYYYNCFDGYESDRFQGIRAQLKNEPVDDYGYVWQATDETRDNLSTLSSGEHRMGWPFPVSLESGGLSRSWDFNGNDPANLSWSSNIGASLLNGLFIGETTGVNSVEFSSPALSYNDQICAYHSPLLELDIRMHTKDFYNIEDVYVWYTTHNSPEFSEDKKVSLKEKSFIDYEFTPVYEHILFLPMYNEEEWKSDKEGNSYIKQIKIEIKAKEGKTISGEFGLNYCRATYDTRHSNNNSIYIASLKQDYEFTGDLNFLTESITKARKAMNFYMQMYDSERHLNDQAYLVGHDGDKTSEYVYERMAMSLGNGYWDILYMPRYDFQSNMYFYKAIKDLIYLEKVLEENNIAVDKSLASVKYADRQFNFGIADYTYSIEDLEIIANDVLTELRKSISSNGTGFWNDKTGRFVAGYSEYEDVWYDYGYTMWNMEAIYYGIASDEQAKQIMDWISGRRIVEGDISTGDDIYYWTLGPRSNTSVNGGPKDGKSLPIFAGGTYATNTYVQYGIKQVQYGGVIMYTSFYDLMSRIKVYGTDDAFKRLKEIEGWYKEVYDYYVTSDNYETHPDRFYWDFYLKHGWKDQDRVVPQNGIKGTKELGGGSGVIGIDGEFLESFLPIASIPYGFFGLGSSDGKTLEIAPSLPTDLDYFKVENLQFNYVKYDLTAFRNGLRIDSVRGDASEVSVQIKIKTDKKNPKVYVNGKQQYNYSFGDGVISLLLPLKAQTIEIV